MAPNERRKHLVFANLKLSYGGGERVLIEQVAAAAELPVRISILYKSQPDQLDVVPELKARNPWIEAFEYQPNKFGCLRWILSNRPDAAVVSDHKQFLKGLRMARWLGAACPTALTLHEHYEGHIRRYRNFRHLITHRILCHDFRERAESYLGPGEATVIHPLYPPSELPQDVPLERMAAREKLDLPQDALILGYVGRQDIHKEPWKVITLAARLEGELGRPVHVLLVGFETPETALRLDQELADSPMRDRVHRRTKMAEIGPAFSALDLFVLPSRQEGFFPLSLIEAMERGVPVISTTVGGIHTILREGQNGLLIPKVDNQQSIPDEALAEAARRVAPYFHTPGEAAALGARGRDLVQSLRESYGAAERYRNVFRSLLNL